ncbi:MAG: family 78 glycoside hydrolase catalytic domain [Lachnospiraceae bacterium]|nr:family 78 glycoside hydrolase catalytic domain [Lachnospiraceae bacterium]
MIKKANLTLTRLQTEAMTNPLGIDCPAPAFSWLFSSDRPGAAQTSFHVVVSAREDLSSPVWDSGCVDSSFCSVLYAGKPLLEQTRYYWRVTVSDHQKQTCTSETAWFETGLMGIDRSVWSSAQWIGAPMKTTNTAALTCYRLMVDFLVEPGNTAGIVLAARNKDNYVLFDLDMDSRLLRVLEYCDNAWDGSYQDGNLPTCVTLGDPDGYPIDTKAVPAGREHKWNRISIEVNKREVTVTLNGRTIIDREDDVMPASASFAPRRSCLSSFGFKQPGSRAEYDHLIISNPKTGDIYQQEDFSDESGICSILGVCENNRLVVENRFELVCPVPAVNVLGSVYAEKEIVNARLYASARGFYTLSVNGSHADDAFYHPGFTDYRKRIAYQTFDVTQLMHTGVNRILATVSKGYYGGYCGYSGPLNYGEQSSFLCKLVITYEDGTTDVHVTDESWLFTDRGPVVDADYLDGENYDARLEPDGWEEETYTDCRWKTCGILPWPKEPVPTNGSFSEPVPFELSAQDGPAAVIERILSPIAVTENPVGHYVYDFGQNMVGTIRLKVRGPRGLSLKLRFGEMSYSNGEIYIRNIRSAANTDTYTLKGDPDGETWVPSHTSHGFRYVEITGNGMMLTDNDCVLSLEGLVLCNTPDLIGDFSCSDELINRLQSNIQWGQRGNSLLVYTDCPQRNERMGWTGDAQVFAGTAAFNMDVRAFMHKWMLDVRDGQLMYNKQGAVPDTAPLGGDNRPDGCAGWGDAAVIVPWEIYKAYGDIRVLEDNYELMKKWIAYQSLPERQNFGLRTVGGVPVPKQSDLAKTPFIQVQQRRGDHLTFDFSTPFILSATAYAAHVSNLMSKIAAILDKPEDAAAYRRRFEQIRQAFQEAWVQKDGSLAYWGEMSKSEPTTVSRSKADSVSGASSAASWAGTEPAAAPINQTRYSNEPGNPFRPSQTAYALAIDFDLMPKATMENTAKFFAEAIHDADDHLTVGFLGIAHLIPALSRVGNYELAYRLLEQKGNPGWLYSVLNGATTIWERWDSYISETGTFGDISMNSFNHYAYGAVGQWLYETVLGIRSGEHPEEAGYKRIYLSPVWGGSLTWAKGWHHSPYGMISSGWECEENQIIYRCTVPTGTTALLTLPLTLPEKRTGTFTASVLEGDGAVPVTCADGCAAFELKPGSYVFTVG